MPSPTMTCAVLQFAIVVYVRLRFMVFHMRTRRRIFPIAWPISFALVPALLACIALWSLARTARLPAPTRLARRTYAPPLRIRSSIVGDEADGLQMRRRGVSLVGMGVLLVLGAASHGSAC